MGDSFQEKVPQSGEWPVDPQDDVPISERRVWVDGCFDFSHHGRESTRAKVYPPSSNQTSVGHAGAMLQARRLGDELLVGVHSDEAILENKGPTVMTLEERLVVNQGLAYSLYTDAKDYLTQHCCSRSVSLGNKVCAPCALRNSFTVGLALRLQICCTWGRYHIR